jgi:hypothetical protein
MSKYIQLLIVSGLFYIFLNTLAFPTERTDPEDEITLPRPIAFILFPPLALGRMRGYFAIAVFMQAGNLVFAAAFGVLALLEHFGVTIPKVVGTALFYAFMAVIGSSLIGALAVRYKKTHSAYRQKRRRRRR